MGPGGYFLSHIQPLAKNWHLPIALHIQVLYNMNCNVCQQLNSSQTTPWLNLHSGWQSAVADIPTSYLQQLMLLNHSKAYSWIPFDFARSVSSCDDINIALLYDFVRARTPYFIRHLTMSWVLIPSVPVAEYVHCSFISGLHGLWSAGKYWRRCASTSNKVRKGINAWTHWTLKYLFVRQFLTQTSHNLRSYRA